MTNKAIVWELLFGTEVDLLRDPNKPANMAYINAMSRAEHDQMKAFVNGPGKVLINRWQEQIRTKMAQLMLSDVDCNCKVSIEIRKIRAMFDLVMEAEQLLNKEN